MVDEKYHKFDPKNNFKETNRKYGMNLRKLIIKTKQQDIDLKFQARNRDRVGHEINGGDDSGNSNPTQVDASWGRSRKSREGQSQHSMVK